MEEERMVTLVCLQSNALAEELQRMLAETGITAYLRNEYTNRIIGPMCDVGGVRIELAESDLEAARIVCSSACKAMLWQKNSNECLPRQASRPICVMNTPTVS